jgi:hypothetical protein
MATSGRRTPVVRAYSGLDSTAAIACVVLKTTDNPPPTAPFVRDISDILFIMSQRGFNLNDLGLRKIPGGYYSEDVETFLGQLLCVGYATRRSPIRLTDEGKEFCKKIVAAEDNKEELARFQNQLESVLREGPVIA